MLRFKSLLIILLSALFVASIALQVAANDDDNDEEVPVSDVPAKVLQAANKAVSGGEVTKVEKEVEDGEVIYDVKKVVDGVSYEIEVTVDGVVKKVEKGEAEENEENEEESAKVWDFQKEQVGKIAEGFKSYRTGKGKLGVWKVLVASENKVLAQVSKENFGYHFNLAVAEGTKYSDLKLNVKFKAIEGKDDQGGGPVWRYRDANNYYIARANPLEDNFRVYKVVDGRRKQLASKKLKVTNGEWHTIGIVMQSDHIQCSYDGVPYLDVQDKTFKSGKIGLWTKADAVTYFDDLKVAALGGKTESKMEAEKDEGDTVKNVEKEDEGEDDDD
ncbi:TPA: hypothetical protein EYP66_16635 [Candidatus Poribacteria bacterium]|nr:hypothetical protein [Candidatus Poribacteria bacterium]